MAQHVQVQWTGFGTVCPSSEDWFRHSMSKFRGLVLAQYVEVQRTGYGAVCRSSGDWLWRSTNAAHTSGPGPDI